MLTGDHKSQRTSVGSCSNCSIAGYWLYPRPLASPAVPVRKIMFCCSMDGLR